MDQVRPLQKPVGKNRKPLVYKYEFEALKQVSNDCLLVGGILCQLDQPVKTFFFTNCPIELPWVLPKLSATTGSARIVPVTSGTNSLAFLPDELC
jgi:hypothetical protein